MTNQRPTLGLLLSRLSPFLDTLAILSERVEISVSTPGDGRRRVQFTRFMAPSEDAIEILRDVAHDAVAWLNFQPEMTRPIDLGEECHASW